MNQKSKKQFTHWLKVIVIGVVFGFALQFVRAWTEPTAAPPNGNVGAPINTSGNVQEKGDATHNGDICVWNGGTKKCLSAAGSGGGDCTCYITCPSDGSRIYSGITSLVGYRNCGSGWILTFWYNVGFWGSGFSEGSGRSGYFKCSPTYP